MKALTIQQPWAWAVANGIKLIENRNWKTNYRGPLLIHAGKSRSRIVWHSPSDYPDLPGVPESLWSHPSGAHHYGSIVGVCELIDCVDVNDIDWEGDDQAKFAEGPWCWEVANCRPFTAPIPYTGRLGLWEMTDERIIALAKKFLEQ